MVTERRAHHDGGLYRKERTRTDPSTGKQVRSTYWEASWEIPLQQRPPGSTRVRITGSGPTKAVARRRLEENKVKFLGGQVRGHTSKVRARVVPTVAELFAVWDQDNRAGAVSEMMAYKYRGFFTNHVLPHVGHLRISQLTTAKLNVLFGDTLPAKRKIVDDQDAGPLLSGSARTNIYRAVSRFLNFAVLRQHIGHNPLRAVPTPKAVTPQVDVNRYSKLVDELLERLTADDHPDRCRWLMQFLGLRRAERLGLCWSDIDNLDGPQPVLTVRRQLARYSDGRGWYLKTTKTGKERRIVIPEPFVSALRTHKQRQDEQRRSGSWKPPKGFADLVFLRDDGSLITLNGDNKDWHRILDAYGLPYWRGHVNRHVTASRLAATDPPTPLNVVYSILGHDSVVIGQYYSRVIETQQVPAMAAYGATFMPTRRDGADGRRARRR
jgi:integrase